MLGLKVYTILPIAEQIFAANQYQEVEMAQELNDTLSLKEKSLSNPPMSY